MKDTATGPVLECISREEQVCLSLLLFSLILCFVVAVFYVFCGLYRKLLDRCALYTILLQVCHTSYITQFTPKQEEQCLQQYRKQCHIIIGGSYNNCYISLQWVSSLWQMWSRVRALQKFVWDRCRGFAGEVWNNFLFQRTFHNEVQPGREKYNHSFPGKKGMRWWAG